MVLSPACLTPVISRWLTISNIQTYAIVFRKKTSILNHFDRHFYDILYFPHCAKRWVTRTLFLEYITMAGITNLEGKIWLVCNLMCKMSTEQTMLYRLYVFCVFIYYSNGIFSEEKFCYNQLWFIKYTKINKYGLWRFCTLYVFFPALSNPITW